MATVTPAAPSRPKPAGRKPQRVLVIGAGPGGLAAAMLLAKAGLQVTVLERQPRPGGRTSAIEADGFRFDLGPTFFLYPRVLERVYRLCGRDLMREVPMTRLDPQYKLVFGGDRGEINCTPDLDRMGGEVAKLCAADGANVRRFIEHNRSKLERFRSILERPFSSWRDLLSPDMLKALPVLRPWLSVDGELRRYFADERVRLAFTFQSKYLGMSPFNCPSLFSILSYLEYDFGVWHPRGGCSAVSEHMATVAADFGADVRLGEPVTELLFDGRRVAGAKTGQGEYRADAVVVNADFAHAMTTLVPDRLRRRWTDAKLAKKRYSCSTYMLYLGIDGTCDDVAHHTIYTAEDYVGNLADIETRRQLTADPSVYVCNPGVTDPTLAPKGMSALYVLAPTPNRTDSIDWQKLAPGYRRTVLGQLAKIGIPDVEKRIRFERQVTPRTWEDEYGVFRGATFNLAHSLRQMLHLRPRNRFEDVPGMYLVGGGTHPGSGLPVIYESARITSRLLLQDLGRDAGWLGVPGAADESSPYAAPVAT
jgi:phytoene desaturase